MTRDEIMQLVNETAPRYQSWGIEAHFQAFAAKLIAAERERCALLCEEVARIESEQWALDGAVAAHECAQRIREAV